MEVQENKIKFHNYCIILNLLKRDKIIYLESFYECSSYRAISSNWYNNLFLSLYSKHFLISEKYITIRMKAVIYLQVKYVKFMNCSQELHVRGV